MNWQEIITEILEYEDIGLTSLSEKTGVSLAHLCHLRNGKRGVKTSPSFDIGLAIIKLHPNHAVIMGTDTALKPASQIGFEELPMIKSLLLTSCFFDGEQYVPNSKKYESITRWVNGAAWGFKQK